MVNYKTKIKKCKTKKNRSFEKWGEGGGLGMILRRRMVFLGREEREGRIEKKERK